MNEETKKEIQSAAFERLVYFKNLDCSLHRKVSWMRIPMLRSF